MHEAIQKILAEAIWAPSGDNSQPWRFEVQDERVKIYNVPERDTSLYNYNHNGSLVALGCLIENIRVASPHYGYTASVDVFPEGFGSHLVATVSLKESESIDDPLYPYIKERCSNRKPYNTRALSAEHKKGSGKSGESFAGISIRLVDGRENIEKLADAASVNEKVVLENKKLHEYLFSRITWDREEDEQKRGFFVKTLELKGPQALAFKLFSHWPIVTLLNKIGASHVVSRDNAKLYRHSGAFVAVTAENNTPVSFLKSGMLAQRFWLTATKLNLAAQPLNGILFLHQRIAAGDRGGLSQDHSSLIENAYTTMENIFETWGRPMTMMFRVGYADKPSARCLRKDPEITISFPSVLL